MVARRREGIGQLPENILAVVTDLTGLAVEKFRSADDFSSKRSANGLMAEAHAENRKFPGKALDQLDGNARLLRRTRTGGNHDAFRLPPGNLFNGNLVVAMHFDLATQLAEVLREVVGKLIVVVEKQNHNGLNSTMPKNEERFLASLEMTVLPGAGRRCMN